MLKFIIVLILTVTLRANAESIYPSLDFPIFTPLPKGFRIPADGDWTGSPTRKGLDKLRISASGQFIESGFILMLNRLPQNLSLIVIDLREESHGFVNGIPISWKLPDTTWTNLGKSVQEIKFDEISRLQNLYDQQQVVLDPFLSPLQLPVTSIELEEDLMQRHGIRYLRLPITENHKPSDETVDQIVKIILNLSEDEWIHVHCHGGKGRTTTFLTLYDILMNGHDMSLEEILERQEILGGTDFARKLVRSQSNYMPWAERKAFIHKFYAYVRSGAIHDKSWSNWVTESLETTGKQ